MANHILIFFLLFAITSCGLQNRVAKTRTLVDLAKKEIINEQSGLQEMLQKVNAESHEEEMDSFIKDGYDNTLAKLNSDLDSIQKIISKIESNSAKKSKFNNKFYQNNLATNVLKLDSFMLLKQKRENIYKLVQESVNAKAFNLFSMAAFFEPGVYKVPTNATNKLENAFSPAIDSISAIANNYKNIPITVRLVFVGYADETPILPNGKLYNELKKFSLASEPSRQELNTIISQLRSSEMVRNMKMIVANKAQHFNSFNSLQFNYFNYGRGEALPSAKITDYKSEDERRRIVMFYWSVLPRLD